MKKSDIDLVMNPVAERMKELMSAAHDRIDALETRAEAQAEFKKEFDQLAKELTDLVMEKVLLLEKAISQIKDGRDGRDGIQGPPGEAGPSGPQGNVGSQGPAGEKGDRGAKGDKGDLGERGFEGPQGQKGDPGEQGERGFEGPPGPQGEKGERGLRGPGFTHYGPWDTEKIYLVGDCVTKDGSTWICNTDETLESAPGESENWNLMCQRGSRGGRGKTPTAKEWVDMLREEGVLKEIGDLVVKAIKDTADG